MYQTVPGGCSKNWEFLGKSRWNITYACSVLELKKWKKKRSNKLVFCYIVKFSTSKICLPCKPLYTLYFSLNRFLLLGITYLSQRSLCVNNKIANNWYFYDGLKEYYQSGTDLKLNDGHMASRTFNQSYCIYVEEQ